MRCATWRMPREPIRRRLPALPARQHSILGRSRRRHRLVAALGRRPGRQRPTALPLVSGREAQYLLQRPRPARRVRACRPSSSRRIAKSAPRTDAASSGTTRPSLPKRSGPSTLSLRIALPSRQCSALSTDPHRLAPYSSLCLWIDNISILYVFVFQSSRLGPSKAAAAAEPTSLGRARPEGAENLGYGEQE